MLHASGALVTGVQTCALPICELLTRAGHWRAPPEPADFPKRMTEETEASYAAAFFEWHATRTDGDGSRNSVALEIFEQNKRLNKPQETREPTLTAWEKDRVVGSGLTERVFRSEEHTSELQSLMRISYAVFCLKKKTNKQQTLLHTN